MPFITIEAVHPTEEQKRRLISEITKAASEILNVDEANFYTLIKENDAENWGVGGRPLPEVLAERAQKKANE